MESEIYTYLIEHNIGKDNMIKNKELRKIFNIGNDRSLRKIIQNIREDKDYYLVIGSKSGSDGGFYVCTTMDEVEETIENIRKRASQMYRTCHILEWKRAMNEDK